MSSSLGKSSSSSSGTNLHWKRRGRQEEMAKSSADDLELRRACEAAIEATKQKVVLSIRVAKSRGIWGKSGKVGKGQMAKPRVLAISSRFFLHLSLYISLISNHGLVTLTICLGRCSADFYTLMCFLVQLVFT